MTFWILIIALGAAWVLQSFLSFTQTQAFTRLFVALRRRGRVAMGKFCGGIAAGSIVMFLLDDDDRIVEGHRLGGITVMARFKAFDDYNGQFVGMIDPQASAHHGKPLVRALCNLRDNYQVVIGGGTPVEPPTALSRLVERLPGLKPRRREMSSPLATAAAPHRRKVVVHRARANV